MSRVAIMSVVLATAEGVGQSAAGTIGKIVAYHGIYDVTTVQAGPTLALGASGFVLKGIEGMTLARLKGDAANTDGTANQVIVLPNDKEYLPSVAGKALSLLQVV